MKKFICLIIVAATLFAPAGLMTANAEGTLSFDANAPYRAEDGVIYVEDEVFAGEIVSCLTDKTGASVRGADDRALAATDIVAGGETLVSGGASAKILRLGDANSDGKVNSRDVVGMMLSIVNSLDAGKTTDVDGDGKLNALDVTKLMKKLVGWDVVFDFPAQTATDEDGAMKMYFASSMQRIRREDTTIHGKSDGTLYTAKNEIETAHFLLTSTEAKEGLTLDVGEIKNAADDVLEREVRYGYYYNTEMFNDLNSQDFHNTTVGWWADPYPTLTGDFAIGANESKSFIVKVKTSADTAAGWYSAPVVVRDAGGNEIKRSTLYVYVWDFAIDDNKLSYTMFSTSSTGLAFYFGSVDPKFYDGGVWGPLYKELWYDYCLENKMNLEELPYNLHDSRVNEYLDDPRVTSFVTVGGRLAENWDDPNLNVEGIHSDYAKLSQKREWLDKAYIYTVDEPYGVNGAELVKKQWNGAKAVLGDTFFQTIIPFGNGWLSEIGKDMLDATYDYCNAFCPLSACFTYTIPTRERKKDKANWPDWGEYLADKQIEKYGQFEPRYEALRARGDKMWWYICIGPYYPHANYWNSYQGAWARVVQWQQYRYNSDGFLYWSISFWNVAEHDSRMINLKRTNNGDGLLAYPGTFWSDTPDLVPSIRLEIVRDALEDFAYLRQLETYIGRDATLEYSNRCTTDVLHYTQDWHDIDDTRDEIGWKLEELNAAH